MAESLAVRYRPREFTDCVGQSSIIKILERQAQKQEYIEFVMLLNNQK